MLALAVLVVLAVVMFPGVGRSDPSPQSGVPASSVVSGSASNVESGIRGSEGEVSGEQLGSVQRKASPKTTQGGLLLSPDGDHPVCDCPYLVVADVPAQDSDPGSKPFAPMARTGRNGEWTVPPDLDGTSYRLVVSPESYFRVEFELGPATLESDVVVLRMPQTAECRVRLSGALLPDGARWDCLVEPWDSRFPERNETIPELRVLKYGPYGEIVTILSASKFHDLRANEDFSYLAPVGSQLVLGPWSEGCRLSGYSPRVVVPSVTVITASPDPGLRVMYQNEAGEILRNGGLVFAQAGEGMRWLRYPMYEGVAFIEGAKFQGEPQVIVEYCAADGEFFRVEVRPDPAVPVKGIEFVKGHGQQAEEVTAPNLATCLSGWYRSGEGDWALISPSGPLAVSARQLHRLDGRVLVSLPAGNEAVLFWADGAVVRILEGKRKAYSDPGAQSFQVVPPHLIQELGGNECLLATLQGVVDGGAGKWVDVDTRRFVAGSDASRWTVREPENVSYRTKWRRLADTGGHWREIDQGVHVVAGSGGFPVNR